MKKALLAERMSEAIKNLHYGNKPALFALLQEIKELSSDLPEKMQKDVIDFVQQVTFQMDYDPFHLVTDEIKRSADRVIKDLGLSLPR